MMKKLNLHDTAGLTRYAIGEGIIESSAQLTIVWLRHAASDCFHEKRLWGEHPIASARFPGLYFTP